MYPSLQGFGIWYSFFIDSSLELHIRICLCKAFNGSHPRTLCKIRILWPSAWTVFKPPAAIWKILGIIGSFPQVGVKKETIFETTTYSSGWFGSYESIDFLLWCSSFTMMVVFLSTLHKLYTLTRPKVFEHQKCLQEMTGSPKNGSLWSSKRGFLDQKLVSDKALPLVVWRPGKLIRQHLQKIQSQTAF